jgi:hypothetical protein
VSLRKTLSLLAPVDLLNRSLSSDELKMELASKTGLQEVAYDDFKTFL